MKTKTLSILISLLLVFSFLACTNKQEGAQSQTVEAQAAEAAKKAEEAEAAKQAELAASAKPTELTEAQQAEAANKAEADKKAAAAKAAADAVAAELKRLKAIVVADPVVTPAGGLNKAAIKVSLACATPEAKLVYTLDGSEPTAEKGQPYKAPIAITASTILKVLAYVPKGNAAKVQAVDYTFDEVCINGGPAGDGTRTRPFNSFAKAVEAAKAMGFKTVKFGPDPINESIEITETLSYLGGWDRSFTKRTNKRAVINGTAMEGPAKKSPGYGMRIAGTKLNEAVFEKLEVHGGEAVYSAGVLVTDGASPTFTNCGFVGGQATYGYGALVGGAAAPSFVYCDLSGGAGASGYGLSADSARATLVSSLAFAGAATVTGAGAMVTDGRINAVNSVLAGNLANVGYGLALYNSKGSKVESCTLFGGSGRDAVALFVSVGDPAVSSSILAADGKKISWGIQKNYGESAPSSLKNLVFVGCGNALYYDVDSKIMYTSVNTAGNFASEAGKTLAKPLAVNSGAESMALGAAPGLRTPADAPDRVATGGLVASAGSADVIGAKRSEPWSIGAYEIDR